jgi:hypothetical protein
MWIIEWMLSVMVRRMGFFTNLRRDFSRSDKPLKSGFLKIEPKILVLPPLRVLDALLTEKSCQMPALISFYHGLRFLLTRWYRTIS